MIINTFKKSPSYKKINDLVIPQPGQGNPVSNLKGHNDCSVSICLLSFWSIIKYGITSVNKAPAIPNILRICLGFYLYNLLISPCTIIAATIGKRNPRIKRRVDWSLAVSPVFS